MMSAFAQDVRYALRMLGKNPGFAAVAVLTLALGIGANTAIFSVVNAVLIHPLPYRGADRLVFLWGSFRLGNQAAVSPADFQDYRRRTRSFEHFSAMTVSGSWQASNLSDGLHPVQVQATMVTAGFFETFGVKPVVGRTIVSADEQVTLPEALVLSYALWQRQFGGDLSVVGRPLSFNGHSATVVGIAPPHFEYPRPTEVWYSAPFQFPEMSTRRGHFLRPVGLLKPGVSREQAQADLDSIAKGLEEQYPETNSAWRVIAVPLAEVIVGSARPALLILFGAVALVLLIACANVANLILTRNTARRKELAIRAALGAGRGALIRQLLTENVLLSLLAGSMAVLLAAWSTNALRSLGSSNLPRLEEVGMDTAVLLFAVLLSLLTGIVFGLLPAFQATRGNLQDSLKEGSRASEGRARQGLRNVLVVGQVSVSLMLLVAAGLLLVSFWRMLRVDPGFRTSRIFSGQILLSIGPYEQTERRIAFFRGLTESLAALPGVESVGAISELPLSGQYNDTWFMREGKEYPDPSQLDDADIRVVTPSYFATMGIPILGGRPFSVRDTPDAPQVVIVSEPFARQHFSGQNPIGKHLRIGEGAPELTSREIVGVVAGVRHFGLNIDPRGEMYVPYEQNPRFSMNMVLRSASDLAGLSSAVRAAVAKLDKDEAVSSMLSIDQLISDSVSQPRFSTLLLGLFASVGLTLAAIGIYGVISFSVTRRTHEIGVRMALGARTGDVLRLVVGQGIRLTLVGAAIGLAGALAASRLLASQLFSVSATDPRIFGGVTLLLIGAALTAAYVPARRAARVDPIVALRYE